MSDASSVHVWLRHEVKEHEHRALLTPEAAAAMIAKGFQVTVERSPTRVFKDADYAAIDGVEMAETGSWPSAPKDAWIFGLKELPENDDGTPDSPLVHKHVFFSHSYKAQSGWTDRLKRFDDGGGELYDLEFMNDANGRRIAAFGYPAGYAGAAIAVMAWAQQKIDPSVPMGPLDHFATTEALVDEVTAMLEKASPGSRPSAMVMGALGRAGRGACDLFTAVGIESLTKWDMAETAAGGPFDEILSHDIFVNCIYLSSSIPPFLTAERLDAGDRALGVVCDVSCDVTNPYNPLPFVDDITTFAEPARTIRDAPRLDVVAIDHTPSFLPRMASELFVQDFLPYALALAGDDPERMAPWDGAITTFREKVAEAGLGGGAAGDE